MIRVCGVNNESNPHTTWSNEIKLEKTCLILLMKQHITCISNSQNVCFIVTLSLTFDCIECGEIWFPLVFCKLLLFDIGQS